MDFGYDDCASAALARELAGSAGCAPPFLPEAAFASEPGLRVCKGGEDARRAWKVYDDVMDGVLKLCRDPCTVGQVHGDGKHHKK